MATKEKNNTPYRKASMFSLIFSSAGSGSGICFYLLMMYASYIANEGFGIVTAVAGMIITGTRIFDGVTDPLVAAIFDRWKPGKHGKIRLFVITGWIIMSLAVLGMYNWLAGRFDGIPGIIVYTTLYVIYIIGATIGGMSGAAGGIVITNDPVQRPFLNLLGTMYSYITPMVLSTLISFVILPRYDNQYNAACLKEACLWYLGFSFVFIIMQCIGLSGVDKPEILEGIKTGDKVEDQKITWRDMWSLLMDNKPLRMYVITGASDKIAQQTSSQTIVVTLMSGILIANYKAATMIGNTGMIVGLLFAFLGGAYIAKFGAKKATSLWSAVAIALSAASILFCVILGPDGMKQIGVMGVPMMIYVVLQVLTSGVKMILTTASGTMRADVTDYELERSGNYMPGTVGGVYSFVDKIISSLSSTIAAFCVAFIGYTTTMPQMGDPVTWPLFWMAMILTFGLPILGWLCNVFAMKGYELSKERMVEVQTNVAERKAAAKK